LFLAAQVWKTIYRSSARFREEIKEQWWGRGTLEIRNHASQSCERNMQ
jgi:hypothetical protein